MLCNEQYQLSVCRLALEAIDSENQEFDWSSVKDQVDQCTKQIYDDTNSKRIKRLALRRTAVPQFLFTRI